MWGEIIIATDAGREGELVARWILDMAKKPKAAQTAVDFVGDGPGDPRRLRPSEGREGL